MNRTTKFVIAAVAVAGGLWLAYAKVLKSLYLDPRAAALQSIAASEATLATYRKSSADWPRVRTELRRIADRTLGGDLETVDHMFRSRLNRIVEQIKLANPAVGTTGAAVPRTSPGKSKFTRYRDMRDEIDYCELEGWVSGSGNFQQVLKLIEEIQAEPWIKRIDQVKFDPRDNGNRFNVTVRLTTLFLPGQTPDAKHPPAALPLNLAQYAALINTNPFRVPPPPSPRKPAEPAVASGPPPFPFEQWALTGVAENGQGTEIWLLNRQTHESRRLVIGEKLDQVILVAAHGETAEFREGEHRFAVAIGSAMSDRIQISQ